MLLFHLHRHIDLEKAFSLEKKSVETPTSHLIVLRAAGKRSTLVTVNSGIVGRQVAPVSQSVTLERPITAMVSSICLSTGDICKANYRRHRAFRTLHPSPTTERVNRVISSTQHHTLRPLSDLHCRCAGVAFQA